MIGKQTKPTTTDCYNVAIGYTAGKSYTYSTVFIGNLFNEFTIKEERKDKRRILKKKLKKVYG